MFQILFKSHHAIQSYRAGMKSFTVAYAQRFRANRDLDLWPSDMVLACDTSSCHVYNLCQIIFKSHNAIQSFGPDTKRFQRNLCTKLSANCDLDLWPSDMILARDTSSCHGYHLCQLFLNPMMQDEDVSRTRFWNTHTQSEKERGKTLYALPPFYGWGIKASMG